MVCSGKGVEHVLEKSEGPRFRIKNPDERNEYPCNEQINKYSLNLYVALQVILVLLT